MTVMARSTLLSVDALWMVAEELRYFKLSRNSTLVTIGITLWVLRLDVEMIRQASENSRITVL